MYVTRTLKWFLFFCKRLTTIYLRINFYGKKSLKIGKSLKKMDSVTLFFYPGLAVVITTLSFYLNKSLTKI